MPPKSMRRPHVMMNMAMSADGKISTYRRESFALGSANDRYLMDVLRAKADAVVVGSGTVRVDGWPILVRDNALMQKRLERGRPAHPLNVILTTRLRLPESRSIFTHPRTEKLFVTTRAAPESRRRRFERHGRVTVVPGTRISAGRVLDVLAGMGLWNVLVEGGGELNYAFFKEDLVDELYITVTPRILGGSQAPTVVDGKGFLRDAQIGLHLVSVRRVGDEVFLKYRAKSR